MVKVFCTTVLICVSAAEVRAAELGPYQLILDRQLLGTVQSAPAVVSPPPVTQTVPSWSNDYRMTMITENSNQLRVGLQNLKDQTSVLLIQGDSLLPDDMFQLVSGDYERGMAVIRNQQMGTEHRFYIQSGPVPSDPSASVTRRSESPSYRSRGTPRTSGSIRSTYPRATPTPVPQVRKFRSREELDAHYQKVQMDAIRTGKPPLPVPLTKQSDDQLVKEGVLPPRQ